MNITGQEKRIREAFLKEYRDIDGNFTMIQNRLFTEHHISKMGKAALTYLCLLQHCNKTSGDCNPSMQTIAMETGTTRQAVSRYIDTLVDLGYIIVLQDGPKRQKGGKGGCKSDANEYILVPLNLVGKNQREGTTAQKEIEKKSTKKAPKQKFIPSVVKDMDLLECTSDEQEAVVQEEVKGVIDYAFDYKDTPEIVEIVTEISSEARKKGYHHRASINPTYRFIKESLKEGREITIKEIVETYRETINK